MNTCRFRGCREPATTGRELCALHEENLAAAASFEANKGINQVRNCVWPNCRTLTTRTMYCPDHAEAARRASWRRSKQRAREESA